MSDGRRIAFSSVSRIQPILEERTDFPSRWDHPDGVIRTLRAAGRLRALRKPQQFIHIG